MSSKPTNKLGRSFAELLIFRESAQKPYNESQLNWKTATSAATPSFETHLLNPKQQNP